MTLTTRFLMACAAIGAATGVLLIPSNYAAFSVSATMPLAYAPMVGLWIIGPVVALAVLRRPGSAVLTMFIAGVISIPTPAGPSAVVTCLMVGVAIELGFLVTRYRIWRPWLFHLTAAVFVAAYAVSAYAAFNISTMPLVVQAIFFALMLASELAFTALGLVVARRLAETGVARGIAPATATRRTVVVEG
ncbi:ECF transporter S component [Solwaraspora sp. WMMB335]|uniref:ECF transporter S component n=1 Tax=Solwaraspora sp. WMMB335 TaxID=3404118 RepID=UPI003B953237